MVPKQMAGDKSGLCTENQWTVRLSIQREITAHYKLGLEEYLEDSPGVNNSNPFRNFFFGLLLFLYLVILHSPILRHF